MQTKVPQKLIVETRILNLELPGGVMKLKHGGVLKKVEVAYESYGELNAQGTNVILVCTPLSMDAHAAGWHSENDKEPGWWDEMIGTGKALDTSRYHVIVTNLLGGCKGTTGPGSTNPDTEKPYGSVFPRISIEDIVLTQYLAACQLGVKSLYAVVGGSLGGMQALQWSISYPDMVERCICVATASQLSPQALGFEILGRKVLMNDKNFNEGDFYSHKGPDNGLAFARMIGLLTYLSADSMKTKFTRKNQANFDPAKFETGYDVESYLKYNSEKFVDRFDANSYLHITYAMDTFDLKETYGSLEKAFKDTRSEFLFIALSSDWLFPTSQSREMCEQMLRLGKIVSFLELDSPYGHDAFLLEVGYLSQAMYGFLNKSNDGLVPPQDIPMPVHAEKPGDPVIYKHINVKNIIRGLIEPGSHILDIGCGKGELIDYLYTSSRTTGFGVDINIDNLIQGFNKNVPVIQGDVDNGLVLFGDKSFDYAILDRTMQMLKKPHLVLEEMLRVADHGIVVFPNFGNIKNRLHISLKGVMPTTQGLPFNWWESPNIHMFTLYDFNNLCGNLGIRVEHTSIVGQGFLSKVFNGLGFKNLGGDLIVAKISR